MQQIKRLVVRYRAEGPSGLVRTHYPDFGPTLACEKLAAHHGHKLSEETLRQWMIAEGLWKPRLAFISVARVGASWCRSTAHPMTDSRVAVRAAP